MALTISHDETERLAQELARETGEPVAQVILEALQQRACRLRGQRARALALARIQAAAHRCAALPDLDPSAPDATLGYGPDGTFEDLKIFHAETQRRGEGRRILCVSASLREIS